jgi:hypothetical protein
MIATKSPRHEDARRKQEEVIAAKPETKRIIMRKPGNQEALLRHSSWIPGRPRAIIISQ